MKGKASASNTSHFICFECRKSFKQRGSSNWDSEIPARPYPCPDCKQLMNRMGKYFKAPPKRNSRQWMKVELLYSYGERFGCSGRYGLGRACRTLPDTVRYLSSDGRSASEVCATLDRIRRLRS